MIPVPKVTQVDLAFPSPLGMKIAPAYDAIPEKYKNDHTKQGRFFNTVFFGPALKDPIRIDRVGMLPREGVDPKQAWEALLVIAGTYGLKHEHKAAAFAYLCDEWFVDIRWELVSGKNAVAFEDRALDDAWVRRKAG